MTLRRLVPAALVLVLAATACSEGGSSDGDGDSTDATSSASASPSASTGTAEPDSGAPTPDANGMTVWGAELALGEKARFSWKPRRNVDGVVELSVDKVKRVRIKEFNGFKLDASVRKSTPYYARVSATNIGDSDLGGLDLPLFLDNGSDVLYPPVNITSKFVPCPNRLLPEKFAPRAEASLCLVFLAAPGTSLRAIALQTADSPRPIQWRTE